MVLRISVLKHFAKNSYKFKVKNIWNNVDETYIRSYANLSRLSPQEVTDILKMNEFTKEFEGSNSIKSYDSNQLASNNPIEDTRSEAKCLLTNGILFGIFDGHGGNACAQVVCKRLLSYIAVSLTSSNILQTFLESLISGKNLELLETFNDKTKFINELNEIYKTSFIDFIKYILTNYKKEFQVQTAIENAFLRLDNDISDEALNAKGKNIIRTLSIAMSGAVAAVAHIDGPHLHVANVGDCQVVLGVASENNGWLAKMMSVEHNTDNHAEVERIFSEHPANERSTVIKMERLLGQLAPLRSLGDFRYKWSSEVLNEKVVPFYGENVIPPDYYTPPYLTAKPEIKYHKLRPQDKFLIIASDGLWDLISPLEAVRLVGEHMSGKRKEGLKKKPLDANAATHLIRNALGGTEYGIDHVKISKILTLPSEVVRLFRDDITVTVAYMDSEFLRHYP
ncbi:PREDICTED: pyruvate dehydrogenase [acetyl-transferring]-phosphatase 1, mitochondrial isoform X2 [Ceratosolen solmsi marchali]|uniref:Pyruvate dehydrogenase [acetyl-transferring]-phosphatase 1, mitochondrial isoform X2 n=1 Tax=Ceratosolen solmsi marchali TaxID=326594 RepID=A0AAJ7DYU1_9HYME|nr:PREDICTED: pyruvate dehydrogenase [acetyl-transferring]-phosphatase 1, mitochondrial isoform X2 [Ceratosolen solmsi marchali]